MLLFPLYPQSGSDSPWTDKNPDRTIIHTLETRKLFDLSCLYGWGCDLRVHWVLTTKSVHKRCNCEWTSVLKHTIGYIRFIYICKTKTYSSVEAVRSVQDVHSLRMFPLTEILGYSLQSNCKTTLSIKLTMYNEKRIYWFSKLTLNKVLHKVTVSWDFFTPLVD